MNINYGLSVTFDGKTYTLMSENHIREYPIGGLICEYCRLSPTEIKAVLVSCVGLDQLPNGNNLANSMLDFHKKLLDTFPPACAIMIFVEFQNTIEDLMKAIREDCLEQYIEDFLKIEEGNQIQDFILKDTPFNKFGAETVFQMMLSAYYSFATSFVNTKFMFNHIVGKEGECEQREKVLNLYSDLYGDLMDMQHIQGIVS